MSSNADCKAIEKGLKDIIFGMSSSGQLSTPDSNLNSKLTSASFTYNEQFSNQEKSAIFNKNKLKGPFPLPSNTDLSVNETSSSKLIDLNALTEFSAKHIDDSSFRTATNDIKLPHPDLEDDNHSTSTNTGVSVLFEQIQNSPNFGNLPENPLLHSNLKSPKRQSRNRESQHKSSSPVRKRSTSKRRRKKKKSAKQKDLPETLTPQEGPKTITKVMERESKEEMIYIQTKKKVFSSIGREYSLTFEKNAYKFQCYICNWTNDNKTSINKHLSSNNHLRSKELSDKDMMLPFLPKPFPSQIEAITELINKEASRIGLEPKDLEIRKALSLRFIKFVQDHVPSCSVHLIGSSAYGIGLKHSEVDFIVKVDEDELVPDALEALYNAVSKGDAYERAIPDFKQKRPQVRFVDKEARLSCNILIDNNSSLRLAYLLSTYCKLDDRVQILGAALRYWAQLCQVDLQDHGTLPPFSYALLLVHFLQQVQPPVLPVLHEVKNFSGSPDFYDKYVEDKEWKSQNTDSIGELWLKFFRFYTYEFKIGESVVCIRSSKRTTCAERNWNTRFYAIEEPFLRRNIAYVIPTFQICQYIQNCFLRTYRYFAYPQQKKGFEIVHLLKTDDFDALKLSEYVKEPLLKEDVSDESEVSDNEDSTATDLLNISQELEDHDPDIAVEDLVSVISNISLEDSPENIIEGVTEPSNPVSNDAGSTVQNAEEKQTDILLKESQTKLSKPNTPVCHWDTNGKEVSKDMFSYKFDVSVLKGEKPIPLTCRLCKKTGHLKKDCPVEEPEPPKPLPPMTQEFLEAIHRCLQYIYEKNRVSDDYYKEVENSMKDVESSIKKVFPDAKLSLFGSFCNGFGFRTCSDMDFCLTFTGHDTGKDLDHTEIIKKVAAQLIKHPKLENIVPITSAKVPIVKFAWKDSEIEGDISLYNTLALINTQMLEAYSKIDPRVQILGYGLKYFAKTLGICDASKGSLSSYAYILMVIFFLQQRNPPVIPVLQELHEGEKPVELIDGWNTWFFKDIHRLKDVWPEYGKNKEPVAQLWVELFNFYTCDFNWREYVIAIKQKNPLRRFKKLWISEELAIEVMGIRSPKSEKRKQKGRRKWKTNPYVISIEDPFDLHHNLGGGLSKKMNAYIMKTFIRGRERFGSPLIHERMHTLYKQELTYFYNRNFLNSGREPPHDRGCGNCGKIGHKRKDCPQEKTCSYCRRPGHLVKNCPRKQGQPKDQRNMKKGNRYNFDSPNNERKGSVEKVQNQRMPQHHPLMNNDVLMRTFPGMNSPFDSQKLLQMGVPMHRMPPPGFPGRTPANPPPGFKNNAQLLQKPAGYASPFPPVPPFPRQGNKKEVLSQSPPKLYSGSPPKNFQQNKYHKVQEPSGWPVNPRNVPFQVERHPNPQRMQGNGRGHWLNNRPLLPHPVQHKSNQHQTMDHRRNRTNSDHQPYNSNSDKWSSR
ncbi:terminal uridylyltransferase 4 isoform X1 [Parasteatoda tepidariorum]|nr:terminal uridylyltransferase 7 isoform X1 [Parasteatoda tepidariorum]XP_042909690.1 terminal uridylyltransferase 7 isoform X1 [Parasteatoda tepidariorum]